MTSSLYSDGPPLTSPSSPPSCGYPNDTTLSLPSLTFIIQQLSTLLLFTSPLSSTPTSPCTASALPADLYTHTQLVAALSNVVFVTLRTVLPPTIPSRAAILSDHPSSASTRAVSECGVSPDSSCSPPPDAPAALPSLSLTTASAALSSSSSSNTTTTSTSLTQQQ